MTDSDYYITNCENYNSQTGTETFTDGMGDYESRNLDDNVTNSLYYTYYDMDGGGGSGGGS